MLQKQLVHLLLIEPKGSKDHDVYINNVLVSEGYAVSLPEVTDTLSSSNNSSVTSETDNNISKNESVCKEKSTKVFSTKDVLNKLASFKKKA